MCLCWVSRLFGMICLFSNCNNTSTTRFRSWCITFSCVVNVPHSYVPVLLAMQYVALRSAFHRGCKHLWIVYGFINIFTVWIRWPRPSTRIPWRGGGNKTDNFGRRYIPHLYYILSLSDLFSAIDKKNFKEIRHFYCMTYVTMPQEPLSRGSWNLQFW